VRLAILLLAALAPLVGQEISRQEYRARRAELRKSLDGILVLFSNVESDNFRLPYVQETNFLYLSGWHDPDAAMILTRDEEIFFLPKRNPRMENFTGRKTGPEDADAPQKTGFDKVLAYAAIESTFLRLLEQSNRVYTLPSDASAQKLARLAPLHEIDSAGPVIAKLRLVKSPAEIDLIAKATEATVAAHLAAWKQIKPGIYEYELAATMMEVYHSRGCEGNAYSPIIGSGPNSVVLHYMANRRRMDSGELVVMDVGAECSGYASDVTRTAPASGKFTPRQREIYEIVLGAQKAAIAAIKPGVRMFGESRCSKSPSITSTRTARTCMASRWASISSTVSDIPWAWTCTIRATSAPRSRPAWSLPSNPAFIFPKRISASGLKTRSW
jgi:Xaa-Pro aminopeptidase